MPSSSRSQAKTEGHTRYFTGKPCKHGHVADRYTSTGQCSECVLQMANDWHRRNPEYQRVWRRENAEHYREGQRRLYRENIEKERERSKEYYHANKEQQQKTTKLWQQRNADRVRETHKVRSRRWAKNNPSKRRAYWANYRAKKCQATPTWADAEEIKEIYQVATDRGLTVDHIVPLNSDYVCGLHVADNLRCIPERLNIHKSNRYWPDMPNLETVQEAYRGRVELEFPDD